MTRASWPGAELTVARSRKHASTTRAVTLAGLALLAVGMVVAPIREPEPITLLVGILAGVGVIVCSVAALVQRARISALADQLIVEGFEHRGRGDATSVVLAARTAYLLSDRHRISLMRECRAQLRLARKPPTPALRAQPYINVAAILQNAGVLEEIAARLERPSADPRTMIELRRAIRDVPLPCGTPEDRAEAGQRFSRELREVSRSLGAPER